VRPPRWAEWLLARSLPEGLPRESVLGDLEEDLQRRAGEQSAASARRWYAGQAIRLAVCYTLLRLARFAQGAVASLLSPRSLASAARQAIRSLRRAPGFVALAALTLGVGIGATTAIFSIVDAVLLRPLPYPEADELVMLRYVSGGREIDNHSEPEYWDLSADVSAFEVVAAFRFATPILGASEPERVPAVSGTHTLLPLLGVEPVLGRLFDEAEDTPTGDRVVVLSHGLWTRALGADPEAVGTTLLLEGRPHTVIGVMPPGFAFPDPHTEAWLPLRLDREVPWGRNNHYLRVIARLADGRDISGAASELDALGARSTELHQDFYAERMSFRPYPLQEQVVGSVREALLVLVGAVAAVLLIAAVNAASLFLARGERRRAEIAVRTALGAGKARVASQLLLESVTVAVLAGGLGIALAFLGVELLARLAPADLPRLHEVTVNGRVLSFGLAVAVATGVVFGMAPAGQAWRADVRSVLAGGGRGNLGHRASTRLRRVLVVTQLSLATMLVLASALLLGSVAELRRVDLGFRPEGVLMASLSPAVSSVAPDEEAVAFYSSLEDRLAELPGVSAVGSALRVPLLDGHDNYSLRLEGREAATVGEAPAPGIQWATPGYFGSMGIALRRGRLFTRSDDADSPPVAVVSEALARELWPGEEPVGRRLRMWPDGMPWMAVVGVVADVKHGGVQGPPAPMLYIPHAQGHVSAYYASNQMSVFVRAEGEDRRLAGPVRETIHTLDSGIPVERVQAMTDVVAASLSRERFALRLLGLFSTLALGLGAVGVYGVVAQVVALRTGEIGLRMAVGAGRAEVAAGVLREGLVLAFWGLTVGLAGGVAAARVMGRLLVGVTSVDPWSFATPVPILLLVVVGATVAPAWRASRLDPVEALRAQ
jgi:putative ABC transport system permease protein